ncbi:hypothetical protein N9U42_00975 [Luminiphilus sp.]|nr:hypothetical protein [Luminiphilus sp.]MDA9710918.1 hypothetical protein [Luminiphilus sp.]
MPAEIGLHEPCQIKNLPVGRNAEPKLRKLPAVFVLDNAPILAISRTITVRFLGHGLARKVALTRVFKETG